MASITIRGCTIGEGRPKIILPIVEKTEAGILARGAEFALLPAPCVEWRADWFDQVLNPEALSRCLAGLRQALGEKLLLVTFRTRAEGGEQALDLDGYAEFCHRVCASGCADLLDLEYFTAAGQLPALIQQAHAQGVAVVCSSHDFAKTPPQAEMVERLAAMQAAGADLPKLAVMPHSRGDLLALLGASAQMAEEHPATPFIAISMGALGGVSRICGEALGSAMTFASAGKASAPGQIGLEEMIRILDALALPL